MRTHSGTSQATHICVSSKTVILRATPRVWCNNQLFLAQSANSNKKIRKITSERLHFFFDLPPLIFLLSPMFCFPYQKPVPHRQQGPADRSTTEEVALLLSSEAAEPRGAPPREAPLMLRHPHLGARSSTAREGQTGL